MLGWLDQHVGEVAKAFKRHVGKLHDLRDQAHR
jgi:hypothetical protein